MVDFITKWGVGLNRALIEPKTGLESFWENNELIVFIKDTDY